jgi:hypothetical protein
VLLISNPTQTAGQFYRAFHSERDQWHTVHVSCTDAPAFTGEHVSDAARAGLVTESGSRRSASSGARTRVPFQVQRARDFPAGSDDTVCALADVESAQQRSYRGRTAHRSSSASTSPGSAPTPR